MRYLLSARDAARGHWNKKKILANFNMVYSLGSRNSSDENSQVDLRLQYYFLKCSIIIFSYLVVIIIIITHFITQMYYCKCKLE